jgi:hypothetical protein
VSLFVGGIAALSVMMVGNLNNNLSLVFGIVMGVVVVSQLWVTIRSNDSAMKNWLYTYLESLVWGLLCTALSGWLSIVFSAIENSQNNALPTIFLGLWLSPYFGVFLFWPVILTLSPIVLLVWRFVFTRVHNTQQRSK